MHIWAMAAHTEGPTFSTVDIASPNLSATAHEVHALSRPHARIPLPAAMTLWTMDSCRSFAEGKSSPLGQRPCTSRSVTSLSLDLVVDNSLIFFFFFFFQKHTRHAATHAERCTARQSIRCAPGFASGRTRSRRPADAAPHITGLCPRH